MHSPFAEGAEMYFRLVGVAREHSLIVGDRIKFA